jgi:hypothetical protein
MVSRLECARTGRHTRVESQATVAKAKAGIERKKEGGAMLMTVHQKGRAPRASSIYCRWIRDTRREGAPLVTVWIDSNMSWFERQFVVKPEAGRFEERALEERGGAVPVVSGRARSAQELTSKR